MLGLTSTGILLGDDQDNYPVSRFSGMHLKRLCRYCKLLSISKVSYLIIKMSTVTLRTLRALCIITTLASIVAAAVTTSENIQAEAFGE